MILVPIRPYMVQLFTIYDVPMDPNWATVRRIYTVDNSNNITSNVYRLLWHFWDWCQT